MQISCDVRAHKYRGGRSSVPSSQKRHSPQQLAAVMTMLFPIFQALLLLLTLAPNRVDGSAAQTRTFKYTDPKTRAQLECDRCPPGTYLLARCTSTKKSVCAPCPQGSFTELWNYIGKCLRCGVCGQNQVVKTACAADSDCQCECRQGFYYKGSYEMCERHSGCPPGHGVLSNGTADKDTVCHVCPNGTFSDSTSALLGCRAHRSCDAAGQQLLLNGAAWHDSLCVSCQQLESRDGAEYLKEILPLFFVHHKMSIRRLRQIVQRLTHEGRRNGGTSQPNLSELHQKINTWVTSATAGQIRQLLAVMKRAGATGAAEKLENKLRRMDSQLAELCALRNEVDFA